MSESTEKQDKKFSHLETKNLRATMIDDPELQKSISEIYPPSKGIRIKLTDPELPEGCEIALEGFSTIVDHAGDHVLYYKVKPEDKNILYHTTPHPDSHRVAGKIKNLARSIGFAATDTKEHYREMIDIMKQKLAGTLKTKPGTHPRMKYVENDSKDSKKDDGKP